MRKKLIFILLDGLTYEILGLKHSKKMNLGLLKDKR